jgi:hypothetical protein
VPASAAGRVDAGGRRPYDRVVFFRRRRRRRSQERPIDEGEAYARLHGDRSADVRVVKVEPRRPRYPPRVSGEDLRRSFEARLDERRPESPTP